MGYWNTAAPVGAVRPAWAVVLLGAVLGLAACGGGREGEAGTGSRAASELDSRYALANRCLAFGRFDDAGLVRKTDAGYTGDAAEAAQATPFVLRPTTLGEYLFFDADGEVMAVSRGLTGASSVAASATRSQAAEWVVEFTPGEGFTVAARADGRGLVQAQDGSLALAEGTGDRFRFVPSSGCADFPEAGLNLAGMSFRGTNPDGTVYGVADGHSHIATTSSSYGDTFHPYGVDHALEDCADKHGPQGSLDTLGNMLRDGTPVGTHETRGWPDFVDWPERGTYTHSQSYYRWIERAWMGGLRLLVTHALGNETICRLTVVQGTDCDEMDGVEAQIRRMQHMQDYIDAQAGGPGRGFLRIVDTPADAREVIEQGKLAVVMAIEAEKLFNCGEFLEAPTCTLDDIDAQLRRFDELGVRAAFINHWYDNAFAGGGLFGPSELVLNLFNKLDTGRYYDVEDCPEEGLGANMQSVGMHFEGDSAMATALNEAQFAAVPTYGPGPHCNSKALTPLGVYVVERLMDYGIIIETDHIGIRARNQVLDLTEARGYPVYAGHFHAGGTYSDAMLRRIYAMGGLAAPVKPDAEDFGPEVRKLRALASPEFYFGVPMSSDVNGASGPGKPDEGSPEVAYPFASIDGGVRFDRQQTGERVFDYNAEGVAHYGLWPEWFEAIRLEENSAEIIDPLFRSAEAYLQMWERSWSQRVR